MSQYTDYANKLRSKNHVRYIFYKLRFLFIFIIVGGLITFFVLSSISGMITDSTIVAETISYGQSLSYKSYGLFNAEVGYEFAEIDSEEWTTTEPTHPGKYKMRATANNLYSQSHYGDIHTFEITKVDASMTVSSTEIQYAKDIKPSVSIEGLNAGDTVSSYKTSFADLSKETTEVTIDPTSIVVTDSEGNDVSDCYNFTCTSASVKILPVALNVYFEDKTISKEYDGTALTLSADAVIGADTPLVEGDTVVSVPHCAGEVSVCSDPINATLTSTDLKIVNASGVDVTCHYTLKSELTTPTLQITKKSLVVTSSSTSDTVTYDGKGHSIPLPSLTGELASTDEIQIVDATNTETYVNVGTYTKDFTFKIVDKNTGDDKSSYYNIVSPSTANPLTVTSTLTINKRDLTINSTADKTNYYLSDTDVNPEYETATTGLADTDKVGFTYQISESKEVSYAYTVTNKETGADVSSNYNITESHDEIKFSKKKLSYTITFKDYSKVYDGTPYSNIVDSSCYELTGDELPTGYSVKIDSDSLKAEIAKTTNAGEYEFNPTYTIVDSNENSISELYDVDVTESKGKITISKRKVNVVVNNLSGNVTEAVKTFDNQPFKLSYDFQAVVNDENSGLVSGHTGTATTDASKIKDYVERGFSIVSEIDSTNTLLQKTLTPVIKDANGNDVTPNYDVSVGTNHFSINKLKLDIQFNNPEDKWYDGTRITLDDVNDYATPSNLGVFSIDLSNALKTTPSNPGKYSLDTIIDETKIKILDSEKNDVTSNCEITTNLSKKSITIKQVKLVYGMTGDYINDYIGSTLTYSTDSNDDSKKLNTPTLIKAKSEYPEDYSIALNNFKVYSTVTSISQTSFTFVMDKKDSITLSKGSHTISGQYIDVSLDEESNKTTLTPKKTNISFKINSFTYYSNSSDAGFQNFRGQSYNQIYDDINNLGLITINESGLQDYKIVVKWKEFSSDEGGYEFSNTNRFNYYVYKDGTDVSEYFNIDTDSCTFGKLTIKKLHVNLAVTKNTSSAQFDNNKHEYSHNISLADSIDNITLKNSVLTDKYYGPEIGSYSFTLQTAALEFKVGSRTISMNYTKGSDSNDFVIDNIDTVNSNLQNEASITKASITFNISLDESIHYYDGRKVVINGTTNNEQYSINATLNSTSLPDGYKAELKLKANAELPSAVGSYGVLTFYDVKIYDSNNVDKTENFNISTNTPTFSIEKIYASVSLFNRTYSYTGSTITHTPVKGTDYNLLVGTNENSIYTNADYFNSNLIFDVKFENDSVDCTEIGEHAIKVKEITCKDKDGYSYVVEDKTTNNTQTITTNKKDLSISFNTVSLTLYPNATYDYRYYLGDGDTSGNSSKISYNASGLISGHKVKITSNVNFDSSMLSNNNSNSKTFTSTELTIAITDSQNNDVSSKYNLTFSNNLTVYYSKPTGTLSVSSSTINTKYDGDHSSDDYDTFISTRTIGSEGEDDNYEYPNIKLNVQFSDSNVSISNLTFAFEEIGSTNSNYKQGIVGSYNKKLKKFSCTLTFKPTSQYYTSDSDVTFNYDSATEDYIKAETNWESNGSVTINISEKDLTINYNNSSIQSFKLNSGSSFDTTQLKNELTLDTDFTVGGLASRDIDSKTAAEGAKAEDTISITRKSEADLPEATVYNGGQTVRLSVWDYYDIKITNSSGTTVYDSSKPSLTTQCYNVIINGGTQAIVITVADEKPEF